MAVYCNNCHKELAEKEESRYSLMWKFSGDMYCDDCLDELESKEQKEVSMYEVDDKRA